MSNLLYSVEKVFKKGHPDSLLNNDKEFFNIPAYQRGYKWSSAEVVKLLDDINNFNGEGEKFYCLQNITLVPQAGYFNVVDGQQRLTTLYILISFLGKFNLVDDRLKYPKNSIRTKTHDFLKEEIKDVGNSEKFNINWVTFIENNPEFDHQDIYYLYSASQTIKSWFKEKEIAKKEFDKEAFVTKLFNHVKLIVNNIEGAKEEKVFGNLNSKRIPLDGADLVRAILITRVAQEESKKEEVDIKNIVRVNERRVRIGWELDEINNWWSRNDVSSFFKQFVSIPTSGDTNFQTSKHPINLLLKLYAEKENQPSLSLDFIEQTASALDLYKDINKLHNTFKDWYQDKEIYHYLGYLFFQTRIKFNDIWKLWNTESKTRNNFKSLLKDKIKKEVLGNADFENITIEDKNWYEDDQASLVRILLILDVISALNENHAALPSTAFSKTGNDIEHIFPQNPKEIKDKKEYIEFLNKYVVKEEMKFDLSNFVVKQYDEDYKKNIEDFIQTQISSIDINSIGNLVLLIASLNRSKSISNNCYAIKRARIIEYYNEGYFIQPHTFKVFVRYFNTKGSDSKDLEHWTNEDIQKNAKAIKETLINFFNTENDEA